jgi:hypothetical protein
MRVALASRANVSGRASATRRVESSRAAYRRGMRATRATSRDADDARTVDGGNGDVVSSTSATPLDATTTRRRALARVTTLAAALMAIDTSSSSRAAASVDSLYDLTLSQYGAPRALSDFRGKVTVVVNVASE